MEDGDNNAGGDAQERATPPADAPAGVAVGSVLFPDNFKGVCSGAGVATATAYDPRGHDPQGAVFRHLQGRLHATGRSSLPDGWTVRFSADGDALRAVDLVVCARRTAAREVQGLLGLPEQWQGDPEPRPLAYRDLRAFGQGGQDRAGAGEDDGRRRPMPIARCSMTFNGESETVDGYASLSDTAVADFLRPHVTP